MRRFLDKGVRISQFDYRPSLTWIFTIPATVLLLIWIARTWQLARDHPTGDEGTALVAPLIPLLGVPFALFGFASMLAPFREMRLPSRTITAITDRRILRLLGGRGAKLHATRGDRIIDVGHRASTGDSGTLLAHLSRKTRRSRRPTYASEYETPRRMAIRHLPGVKAAARAADAMKVSCAASSLNAERGR